MADLRSWWKAHGAWLPRLCLFVLLTFFLGARCHDLSTYAVPFRGTHANYELVARMIHLLEGYVEEGPGSSNGPRNVMPIQRASWTYACPDRQPIQWTEPTSWFAELKRGGRLAPLWDHFQTGVWTEMPHPMFVAATGAMLLPNHVGVPPGVLLGYAVLLLLSAYGICREMEDEWAGVLAVGLLVASPAIARYSLAVSGTLPILALTTCMVFALIRSRGLTRPLPCIAYALMAWSVVRSGESVADTLEAGLTVCFPFVAEFVHGVWSSWKRRAFPFRTLAGTLAILAFLSVAIDLHWVHVGLSYIWTGFDDTSVGGKPIESGAGPVLEWISGHLTYGLLGWSDYLGPLGMIILIAGVPFLVTRRRLHLFTLLGWFLVPFLALNGMTRKAEWYGFVLVASMAVLAAVGFVSGPWRRLGRPLVSIGSVALLIALGMGLPQPSSTPASPSWVDVLTGQRLVDVRVLYGREDSMAELQRQLTQFVDWSWEAMPPDGNLHYIALEGRPELPAVRYLLVVMRHDLVPVELSSQHVQRCIGQPARTFDLLIHFDDRGTVHPFDEAATSFPSTSLAGLAEPADGAPSGVYRIVKGP